MRVYPKVSGLAAWSENCKCATRCSSIVILWVILMSFASITLCVASQRVFIVVISLSTQSENFWIRRHRIFVLLTASLVSDIFRCNKNVSVSFIVAVNGVEVNLVDTRYDSLDGDWPIASAVPHDSIVRVTQDRVLLKEGKVNKKPLCLTKHHAMKTYWGMDV
jgi:hypothetical protein